MILNATLLSTQHYKVRIKGKMDQSREWSSTLPYTGNEGVLCIAQIFKAGASQSDDLMSYSGYSLVGGVLTLCRDAVGVFFSLASSENSFQSKNSRMWRTWNKYDDAASHHMKRCWFGLVSLFNGIPTFVGYIMPQSSL